MLSVHDLTRCFGSATALDHVSFDVRPGRITGFVGGNGAGKTTTMRIMVGVLAATAGDVRWDGSPLTAEWRRSFGYMPEERGLYPKMRVLDQLVFFGRIHGMTSSAAARRATGLLDRLGLTERRDDVLETLSLGNQQRVQIAAALVHHPSALVLDEPFSGLDPLAVDAMVELLRDEITPEMPVLFSSHQLELVERLSDDLVILSSGRVVVSGAVEALRRRERDRFRVRLAPGADTGVFHRIDETPELAADGSAVVSLGEASPEDVLARLVREAPVAEFARESRPLAEIYREAVR
ncbi:MAG TPA: ATP-binding cassette domain-containing protein [Marmoricola sp.]|nr:ATP-binding cassette domain-containing protein [Marmoricola sp.]